MSSSTLTKKAKPQGGPTHGTATFFDDPAQAASQASIDLALLSSSLGAVEDGKSRGGNGAGAPLLGAAGVSAAAGVASALFIGGNFGLGVANAAKASNPVELTITNYSSYPVVMYDYRVSNIDVADVPNPLISGASDVFGLTGASSNSAFTALFMVGKSTAAIPFQVQYSYVSNGNPGRWALAAGVDGSDEHSYPQNLQMFGFSFAGTAAPTPSFSVYTSTTETNSGALSLVIYSMG